MKKVTIGLIIIGFAVIAFWFNSMANTRANKIIKQEAITCIEGGQDHDSMGDCRVINIHSAYIDSKDNNITVIFYDQGMGKPDHVVEIKNDKVIDYTSQNLNGISFNKLKKILNKNSVCIVYEAIIYKYEIIQSDKNLTCDAINAQSYADYLTKVIKYKNDNPSILETSACSKILVNTIDK